MSKKINALVITLFNDQALFHAKSEDSKFVTLMVVSTVKTMVGTAKFENERRAFPIIPRTDLAKFQGLIKEGLDLNAYYVADDINPQAIRIVESLEASHDSHQPKTKGADGPAILSADGESIYYDTTFTDALAPESDVRIATKKAGSPVTAQAGSEVEDGQI